MLRDDGKSQGTDAERKLFGAENSEWKKTATKLAENGVGIDFFLASASGGYMDLATIGNFLIPHYTNISGVMFLLTCVR